MKFSLKKKPVPEAKVLVKPCESLFGVQKVDEGENVEDLVCVDGSDLLTMGKKTAGIPCKNLLEKVEKRVLVDEDSVEVGNGLNFLGGNGMNDDEMSSDDERNGESFRKNGESFQKNGESSQKNGESSQKNGEQTFRKLGFRSKKDRRRVEKPLLMKRRKIFTGDLRCEVDSLPDVDPLDHDRVPLDGFGLAMLIGMGYDPESEKLKKQNASKIDVEWRGAGLGTFEEMRQNKKTLGDKRSSFARGPLK
eukprot:CAMPEP_0113845774 /NCGR_PEP_ID=MMETSP0372-20130328/943_1 /TAXON_ID=340204 /ORGANISM="Lankesteria abbotti" /LENGTH=248 /DNA_ID=CAMNT_0000814853 /DNA_START=48 /DNA_END=794 /DNA_ORIENTATION=- /assembly_acc=CAM_ASM_000359